MLRLLGVRVYMGLAMDSLTPAQRSERMSRVKSKDTKPEVRVRRLVHSLGYRYRLHSQKLPGCPDLVFGGRRKAIFVHGCFWHRHPGCKNTRLPKSKLDFWKSKLEENRKRDLRNQETLRQLGWEYLVVWECETRDVERLTKKIVEFLEE